MLAPSELDEVEAQHPNRAAQRHQCRAPQRRMHDLAWNVQSAKRIRRARTLFI